MSSPKVLSRSTTDRRWLGVCGGLGAYFRIDPVWFRLGFVLLTLTHGVGLLLYVILAILMPEQHTIPSPADPAPPSPTHTRHVEPQFEPLGSRQDE